MNDGIQSMQSEPLLHGKLSRGEIEFDGKNLYNNAVRFGDLADAIDRIESHHERMSVFVEYVSKSVPTKAQGELLVPTMNVSIANRALNAETLLNKGSKISGLIFLLSLFSWLYADVPLINPFISILGLVASPFFYLMSCSMKKNLEEQYGHPKYSESTQVDQ